MDKQAAQQFKIIMLHQRNMIACEATIYQLRECVSVCFRQEHEYLHFGLLIFKRCDFDNTTVSLEIISLLGLYS